MGCFNGALKGAVTQGATRRRGKGTNGKILLYQKDSPYSSRFGQRTIGIGKGACGACEMEANGLKTLGP